MGETGIGAGAYHGMLLWPRHAVFVNGLTDLGLIARP